MKPLLILLALLFAGCAAAPGEMEVPIPVPIEAPGPASWPEALLLDHYTGVTLEVHYVEGRGPPATSLASLVNALENVTRDPVTIIAPESIPGIAPDPLRRWDYREAYQLEAELRTPQLDSPFGFGNSSYLHLILLDGVGQGPTGAVGGLWMAPAILVWPDALIPEAGPAPDRAPLPNYGPLLTRIFLHEAGHAFGLVNCGIPMTVPRQVAPGDCHSTSDASVMGRVDTPESMIGIVDPQLTIPTYYDGADLADIEAFVRAHPRAS